MQLIHKAIKQFVQAQVVDPNFLSAVFHEGLMLRYVGKYNDALQKFSQVQRKLPNRTVYYERGLVYQKMGNHELAIEDFNKAIHLKQNFT